MSRIIDADDLQKLFNEVSTDLLRKPTLLSEHGHMVRAFIMTTQMIQDAPTIDAVPVVRCKDCKYFERDHFDQMDGFPVPLITAHEICTKWGNGCKTNEDGFCFMGETKGRKR